MPLSAIQNVYHRAFGFKETAHLKWVCVKYWSLGEPTRLKRQNLLKQGRRHQILQFDGLQHRVRRVKRPFYIWVLIQFGSTKSSAAPPNKPTAENALSSALSSVTPENCLWEMKHINTIFFSCFLYFFFVFFCIFFYHRYVASFLLVAEGKKKIFFLLHISLWNFDFMSYITKHHHVWKTWHNIEWNAATCKRKKNKIKLKL